MATTRRKFLAATTGAAAGWTLVDANLLAWANQQAPRVRRDVATLNSSSPEIQSMKIAVEKMKTGTGLGNNDRRRWAAQARIHGSRQGFLKCQHRNWYFLPWHRAYLFFFEEIVRELSANNEFALPYWNWTKDRTLPQLFWAAGNPLHNPPRNGEPGSGRDPALTPTTKIPDEDYIRLLSKTVISQLLGISDFEIFGGGAVDQLGQRSTIGRLEGTGHNYIHTFVGGDMGTGGSPLDPIFWLHHCNVDRLWTLWAARNPQQTPNDADWLNTAIPHFCDRQGNATSILVKDTLNTTKLGYVYDQQPTPLAITPNASRPVVLGALSLEDGLVNNARSFAANAGDQLAATVAALTAAPELERKETVRLRISGIEPPKDNVVLDLFLNCENISPETPITDDSYVGSCTFFDHGDHGEEKGHHGENRAAEKEDGREGGVAFVFDLTPEFVRLYGGRPLAKDEPLKVSILTRPLALHGEKHEGANVKVQEINPQQVSIDVLSRNA